MSVAPRLLTWNFAGLVLANAILGAAFPIQLILGGLAGLTLAPEPALATLPSATQTLAGMLAAAPVSLLMGRAGRRAGFALGGLLTLFGAAAAVQALYAQSFALLCAAHFLMGAGWAAFQYFRFAAAEAVERPLRPAAISLMLGSLLAAAIAGPQIFFAARDALAPIPFAGAYAATGGIALLGLLPLAVVRMRPAARSRAASPGAGLAALRRPSVRRAVAVAALAQGVMVFLMIPTPIAMVGCGFAEDTAGDVVRWHIVAMFAPSFVTGSLIGRFGAQAVATLGLGAIVAAAAIAAIGLSAAHFYGALVVLGVGWNLAFVGATAMLDAAISEDEKAAVQGVNDSIVALVSAICALAAGFALSTMGWAALAMLSGGVVLAALGAVGVRRRSAVA